MSSAKRPERWRVKLVASVIRQVRGKPLLEALFNLQRGICTYDLKPCLLLLPPTDEFKSLGLKLTNEMKSRCATIDHVIPRALGGSNNIDNYAMSSQVRNCEKGALLPMDQWKPKLRRFSIKEIEDEIIRVELYRWKEAERLAKDVSSKIQAKEAVVRAELEKLYSKESIEIYKPRRVTKIKSDEPRGRNGEKKKRKIRRHRRRARPTRPNRTVKDNV